MNVGIVLLLVLVILGVVGVSNDLDAWERRYARLSLAVHVIGSFVHWGVLAVYYSGQDAFGYQKGGEILASLLQMDFGRYAPEIVKLGLHMEPEIPWRIFAVGTPSATMDAISGLIVFLAGPALITLCLVTTYVSWLGAMCMYRAAREEISEEQRKAVAIGFLFVPSVVFWGAGITKEGMAMGFLGLLFLSTYRVLRRRSLPHVLGMAIGAVGVGFIKPYILLAYVVAVAAALYAYLTWRQSGVIRLRLGSLLLAGALALGGLAAVGSVAPEFAASTMSEKMAIQQEAWQSTDGGSNIDVGGGESTSTTRQITFVPLAIVNVLLRPALFEAKNVTMLVAALENTLIFIGFISVLRKERRVGMLQFIARSPFLVFSVAFVLAFGTGVGLATSNLGSLSRYRIPMMPFYVATLLVLRARSAETAASRDRERHPLAQRRARLKGRPPAAVEPATEPAKASGAAVVVGARRR